MLSAVLHFTLWPWCTVQGHTHINLVEFKVRHKGSREDKGTEAEWATPGDHQLKENTAYQETGSHVLQSLRCLFMLNQADLALGLMLISVEGFDQKCSWTHPQPEHHIPGPAPRPVRIVCPAPEWVACTALPSQVPLHCEVGLPTKQTSFKYLKNT